MLRRILKQSLQLATGSRILYRLKTAGPAVALTFDDGPNPDYTPRILDILDACGIKACFFMTGENIARHPELVREASARGHLVGNHSFSHRGFGRLGARSALNEILETQKLIRRIIPDAPFYFRPPQGSFSLALAANALRHGFTLAYWSWDSLDYLKDAGRTADHAEIRPGDILLMHDDNNTTLQLLPALIGNLRERGFSFVSMKGMPT